MLRKILIADDSRVNRKLLRAILKDEYELLEAENGKEALELLTHTEENISAVLLDIVMPEMNGYEVLSRMRKDKKLSQIPVLVTTGNTEENAELKALSLGANDYITKPYNGEIIKHRLHNTISFHETAAVINSAKRDGLTNVYNRGAFFDIAAEMIAAHPAGYYVISCFDINSFKVINDQYGTKKGDEVLCAIADIFNRGFESAGGICCRIMADNFAVLYPQSFMESKEIGSIRQAATLLDGSLPPITFSIGRYIIDDLSLPVSAMYDRASMAKASVKGRFDSHIAQYDESMREQLLREQEIISEMRTALDNGHFMPYLQPQYNHNTGALIGAEALARWKHPLKGMISPGEFIPIFERNGFIYELDRYIWEQCCILLRKWIDEGRSPLPISVNISRCDIFRKDLIEVITGLVEKYRLPAELLRLEITESAFAESTEKIISVVKRLIDYGFLIEIDDFGSGYSSLNTLKDVPADVLKLDMRFLENDENSSRGGNIIESIVRMAKWLGMSVIAEGVEIKEQADYLKTIGCSYVQGYLYARPMPVEEYEALMENAGRGEKMLALENVESFDNNAFWNPKSMDTLIFNSYVGGACIFEYHNGSIEILRANDKYARVLCGGDTMTLDEALKISWAEHLDEKNRALLYGAVKESIENRDEASVEIVFMKLPGCGSKVYLRSSMRVIASAGSRYLVYCTNENITKQREAEINAERTVEQLEAIMRNINGGVTATVIGDDRVRFLYANDRYYEQLGYTREQFEKETRGAFTLIYPEDRERVIRQTKLASESKRPFSCDYRAIRRDGGIIWLRSNISVMSFPGIDEPVQLAVANDITAQRNAEQKERETSEQMQAIMQNISGGVSAATLEEGKVGYIFANNLYYSMFGYTKEQFKKEVPNGITDLIHPDDLQYVVDTAMEFQKGTDKMFKMEYRAFKRDKSMIWVRSNSSICHMSGYDSPVQLAVSYDITKEKEAENKLREAGEQLRFLNDTAHDLLAQADPNIGINSVLKKTMDYFGGDRAYIYEYNFDEDICANTYEVCAPGIKPYRGKYSRFPLETAWYWIESFKSSNFFYLEDSKKLPEERRAEREVHETLGTRSALAVSLRAGEKLIGTMGVFNPVRHLSDYNDLHALGDYMSVILARRDLNAKIKNDNEALLNLMNDTPGGFVRMRAEDDGRLTISYLNDGFADLLGMTKNEAMALYGGDIMAVVHPEDLESVKQAIRLTLNGSEMLNIKYRLLNRGGEYIWAMVFGRLTVNEYGERFLNMYYADISEQNKSEEQRKALIENLPCGAGIYEIKNNNLSALYLNKRYRELVGRRIENVKTAVLDVLHPDDKAPLARELLSAAKEGRAAAYDLRIIHADGEYRSFHFTGNIEKIADGRTIIYATYTPISKEEIEYREMLPVTLAAMMKSSSELSFVKDRNFRYICCSQPFLRLAGLSDEKDVIGKTDYELFSKEHAEKYRADDCKLIGGGESLVDCVERIPSSDGMAHYSSTSKYLLHDSFGRIIGIYGTGRDITEHREAFAQLKLLTDSIPGGLATYACTKESIKLIYFNDGFCDLIGSKREEYDKSFDRDILNKVYKEDYPEITRQLDKLMREGAPINCTYRIHLKDGGHRWINLRGVLSERHGDTVIVNTVMYDVTKQRETEEKLRINEEEIRIALSQIGKMVLIYDVPARKLTMPDIYAKKHGLPNVMENVPRSIIGQGIISEKDSGGFSGFYEAIIRGEKTGMTEAHIVCPGNVWIWERAEFVTIFDNDGKPIKAIVSVEDTSQEHAREERQRETERRYEHELQLRQEIIKDSVIYYELNLSSGMIEEYRSLLSDVPSMKASAKINEDIRGDILRNVAEEDRRAVRNTIFSKALMKAYKRGESNVKLEYRRNLPGLGMRWVRATASIMKRPNPDEIIAFLYIRDIDVEKKDKLALESMIDEEIESVCIVNTASGMAHMAKEQDDLGDFAKNNTFMYREHVEYTVHGGIVEEDRAACEKFFELKNIIEALKGAASVMHTYRIKDDKGRILRKRTLAYYLDGSRSDIVLSRRDITDLYEEEQRQKRALEKAVDEANEASRAKTEFLSRMSHDMRTPMNAVIGLVNLAREENNPPQTAEYLETIDSSSHFLLGLINDILDLSKIESGKIELHPEPFPLGEFKRDVKTIIQPLMDAKNIDFVFDMGCGVDNILVDKLRFSQIFFNLLSNASKYTGEGGRVEFLAERIPDKNGKTGIRYFVRDNGIGMSEKFLEIIFDPFSQERSENDLYMQGSGLGLAIVKNLVEAMDGTISVSSTMGEGSEFIVELYTDIASEADMANRNKVKIHACLDGLRILVVEDNKTNVMVLKRLLEKKNIIVEVAENGLKAVEMFSGSERGYYSAVLMDVRMPVMDGIEAARRIRAMDKPEAGSIPIIAMTADAFTEDQNKTRDAGMNAHITKPIEPELLFATIAEHIMAGG